jgi:hypothetical protein
LEAEQLRNSVKDREIQQLKYELQVKQNALTAESCHRSASATPDSVFSTLSPIGPLDYAGEGGNTRQPRNRWSEDVI